MDKYIVTLAHLGNTVFLRHTAWTAERDRATEFDTKELAQASLLRAKQFMKATQFKAAVVRRV